MNQKNKTVLVIDDDPDIVGLLTYNLKKEGFETLTAPSGIQAIWNIVTKDRPDCILLDLMMPSPDGVEICDYLKSSEDYREIPVIIISAKGTPEEIEQTLNLGADAYLVKPFSMESLMALVKKYSTSPRGRIRFPGL